MAFPWEALVSGGLSLFGGSSANRARRAEAQRNRDFQERMSSTAHQREVADLRAAGLNPILSATGGSGASSPGGNMAQQSDIATPAVTTALAARRQKQEIKNMKVTEKLIREQWLKTNAEANSARQTAMMNVNQRIMSDIILEIDRKLYTDSGASILRSMEKFGSSAGATAGGLKSLINLFKR